MEVNSPVDSGKKAALEDLSREELIKRCKALLGIAQKAKQTKDALQDENNTLKSQLNSNPDATAEMIDNLTQQKLVHITTIEDLKNQNNLIASKSQKYLEELGTYEERNNALDSENVAYKRQIKRLTDENEQLIAHLETLEGQIEECKRLGLDQQTQLLNFEKRNEKLEDTNAKLLEESRNNEGVELQKMLSISLEEVKKLKAENGAIREKQEVLQITLSEKDKNILTISEELRNKIKEIEAEHSKELNISENNEKLREKVKLYHSKILKIAGNLKTLKESKNDILALFKTYTEQVEEWKKQLSDSSKRLFEYITNTETENQELHQEISVLRENNAKFAEQLKAHKTDDEKSKDIAQMEKIKSHNSELSLQIEALLDTQKETTKNNQENEKICLEYRKVISKLEETIQSNSREIAELHQKNLHLHEEVEHFKVTEKEFATQTSEEIMKLVQENTQLSEKIQSQEQKPEEPSSEFVNSLKRENSELLTEMNEMNQALKERGETISKLESHCEEIMKKVQVYESQANKNVDSITQKEEIIKKLQSELERISNSDKDTEITQLRAELDQLRERMDCSYAESETMSTSTISRSEEVNRLKDLEGSWEERYGKLRNLALKQKGKIRELTSETNDLQQKCVVNAKTITTLQSHSDNLQDQLETTKKHNKEFVSDLEILSKELSSSKQKLDDSQRIIAQLRKELEDYKQDKSNTETWKKQISTKVQTLRKELDANKVLKKEFESNIAKLNAELAAKEQSLKAEIDSHQHTKNSLELSNNERKKNSVLNLEMQDYERSVKELSQKVEKKLEEIEKLKNELESQKSSVVSLKKLNQSLEDQVKNGVEEADSIRGEMAAYKKQVSEGAIVGLEKEEKLLELTRQLEASRCETEELSTELSKTIAEHQKSSSALRGEKEVLRSQSLGLQQTLRETQDVLKLKEEELASIQSDYDGYKVRAQSVLRQNQSRDVGLEEKLVEELTGTKAKCENLTSELLQNNETVSDLKKQNEDLARTKLILEGKLQEIGAEVSNLKARSEQLENKHHQVLVEHSETVRSLKLHADTLAQCYRQQLSEQEVRHNREIIELQSKLDKAPSPTEFALPLLPSMHREEGEGSESTESVNRAIYPVPLERLLGNDSDQEVAYVKKQLTEEESKVIHLTALLSDTEQDLAKHSQMNKLLKEEIRRQQRSVEREKHAENLEYLKNVVFKFVTLHSSDERSRLVPVLNTILKLSPEETEKLNMVAKGDPGLRGWTNYLPSWSPRS